MGSRQKEGVGEKRRRGACLIEEVLQEVDEFGVGVLVEVDGVGVLNANKLVARVHKVATLAPQRRLPRELRGKMLSHERKWQ